MNNIIMNKNDTEVVKFIEANGFILDSEDMIWYTKDYKQRVVVQKYCKHPYSIYYKDGFKNGDDFTTVLELQTLINAHT